MPTYEYACKDCGEHLDVVQSFHDDPLTECPNCGGSLRKVFSAAGIIFKGSGWHVKDYATTGSGSSGNGSSTGGSSSDGDTTTSETSTSSSDSSSKKESGTSSGSSTSDSGSRADSD